MKTGTIDQPYEIEEFSGGITDYYVEGPKNAAQYMENLVLTPNRKMTTRDGISYFVDAQVNTSATRLHVLNHLEEPLVFQARKAWYKSASNAFTQIFGPNSGGATDPALADAATSSTSILSHALWKGQSFVTTDDIVKPQKLYKDSGGTWRVRNMGLPEPASLSATAGAAGTTYSYLYALCYKYSYTVGAETFETLSAPIIIQATAANAIAAGAANTITLTLPTAAALGENYDVSNITQEIYRSVNNGVDYYKVTSQTGATASYGDTMTDATLLLQSAFYMNGGIQANDAPPKCKFIHVMGDTAYFGYLKDSSGTYAYQLRQSKPGSPESVPGVFNLVLKEAITGVSSHNDKPIVMCTNQVIRVEGSFDRFGRGFMRGVEIHPSAGCAANNSIVQTPYGVFWFGNDGVYMTVGYDVVKISPHLDQTYANLTENATKRSRIQGTYHADLNAVIWVCCREEASNENDSLLVLDLRWGIRPQALDVKQTPASFYFWEGTTFSAVRWINRQLLLGTSTGYLDFVDPTKNYDIKYAATGSPSAWVQKTIMYQWTSTATDFGTKFYRKWVTWFLVSCTSSSNLSMTVTSIIDNGKKSATLTDIRYRGNLIWGISSAVWATSGYVWGNTGTIDIKRRVPKNSLRCMHRQVQIENASVVVLTSTEMGTIALNRTLLTATLSGTLTWPSNFVDFVIAFSNDDYVREFTISTVSTNTVTFLDPDNLAPATGTYSFVVRGYPKGETLDLNGIQMWWQLMSKTQTAFTPAQTGEP